MLPRKHRLPLRTELKRLQKEGKLFQGRLFSLLVCPTSEVKPKKKPIHNTSEVYRPSRFGFIISTKIHKKAVKRNRAKRLLTEVINELIPEIKPGFEVVFLAKKGIINADSGEIKKEVENLFQKTGLIP